MIFRERNFSGLKFNVFLSGSAVYGYDEPGDLDYVVDGWQDQWKQELESAGYKECFRIDHKEYPSSLFWAYRKGHINLIFATAPLFLWRWKTAHDFLINHPEFAKTKDNRKAVFEYYRKPYGLEHTKVGKAIKRMEEIDREELKRDNKLPF